MRLFIAIHFSRQIKDVLLKCIDDLRSLAVSGNFTREENLHLTLAFIGESNDVRTINRILDGIAVPPFNLTVGGFGHFGYLYWVGVDRSPALAELAGYLRRRLLEAGFDIEKRPFRPHITVARQLEAALPIHADVPKTTMTVSRVSLMKSERINGKLTYTEVYSREL